MDILQARSTPNPDGPHRVTGRTVSSNRVIEAFRHKHDKSKQSLVLAGDSLVRGNIDVSWLNAASETYGISGDPRDYVLVDIPIVTVDVPNRNLQAFPFEEVSYFDPLYGRMVYQTFNAKPCHQDHDNKDPLRAKGVIFDSSLEKVPAYGIWKIRILSGWDRTKDRHLVDAIVRKQRTGYSMGALVENFVCSNCGQIDTNMKKCSCMAKYGGPGHVMPNGNLVYQQCVGANFIENSSVDDPADITAETEAIWG